MGWASGLVGFVGEDDRLVFFAQQGNISFEMGIGLVLDDGWQRLDRLKSGSGLNVAIRHHWRIEVALREAAVQANPLAARVAEPRLCLESSNR
jgi:hypothetical protein